MSKANYRPRVKQTEYEFIKKITDGKYTGGKRPRLTEKQYRELIAFRSLSGVGNVYKKDNYVMISKNEESEYKDFLELTALKGKFELYDLVPNPTAGNRETVAIAQFSDQHIDEVVEKDSVLGMNEYNFDIAKKRFDTHFYKLNKLITHHQAHYNIKNVFLLFQGDTIGGWIHDELAQTNSMSPNKAIFEAKSMYISGLKYLHDNLDVDEITVVCICGNHSRETKKVQFANFNETNKEFWMYLEIENICKMLGLSKLKFIIPKAEIAILNIFGKRYAVAHGHQFKFAGGIGGIFPSMLRWFANLAKTLKIESAFIGHWHTSIFTSKVIVNGSMKGYDAFALSKMLEFQQPSQNLILLDSEFGLCNFQPIVL